MVDAATGLRARGETGRPVRLQRNVCGDFSAWHRGRPWFLLWALDVDVPELRPSFTRAQRQLAPWLLDGYRRQPHVTLGLCGFPVQQEAGGFRHAEDGTPKVADPEGASADACPWAALHRHMQGLSGAGLGPFEIEVGRVGTFATAPFLVVRHAGELDALRTALALDPALQHLDDYLPHVTLGLYRESWLLADLLPNLAVLDMLPPVSVHVQEVALMAYAAAQVGGPLVTVATFDLSSRRLRWHPAASCVVGTAWLEG